MYGGELIHQTHDDFGIIEVVEQQGIIRSLHFGNMTQQSSMLLCNPFFLIHKYAQAMLTPLLWINPARVLVLGLGSGSIVKYLYNYHTDIHIDAIELRSRVIDIASEYFLLPGPDNRLNIINESAHDWLKINKNIEMKYDLIIVDMFLTTESGDDVTVDVSSSFDNIYKMLSKDGVVVFNHLAVNNDKYPGIDSLKNVFDKQMYSIDIESINSILLASGSDIPITIKDNEFKRLSEISTLPYRYYFNQMKPLSFTI